MAILFALGGGCGDGDDATPPPPPTDACVPHLPPNWAPQWKPPIAPRPDACSVAQIEREYTSCEGSGSTAMTCSTFRNDPANAVCLACLFSRDADTSYGPIIQADGIWKSNTAGCIALTDGDATARGCGARVQAASACSDAACDGCTPLTSFVKCRQQAADTACRPFHLDAVCLLRPEYAACTEYATNQEYFRSSARLFCGNGMSYRSARGADGLSPRGAWGVE